MKFWTDHQETESQEESKIILRTWYVISSPSPSSASVVLGENLAHLRLKLRKPPDVTFNKFQSNTSPCNFKHLAVNNCICDKKDPVSVERKSLTMVVKCNMKQLICIFCFVFKHLFFNRVIEFCHLLRSWLNLIYWYVHTEITPTFRNSRGMNYSFYNQFCLSLVLESIQVSLSLKIDNHVESTVICHYNLVLLTSISPKEIEERYWMEVQIYIKVLFKLY